MRLCAQETARIQTEGEIMQPIDRLAQQNHRYADSDAKRRAKRDDAPFRTAQRAMQQKRANIDDAPEILRTRFHIHQAFPSRRATASAAMASEAVRPGLSMPKRLTRPGSPCVSGPDIPKSAAVSPGPLIFGRMTVIGRAACGERGGQYG